VTDLSPDGPFGQVSTGHLPEDTTVRELVQAAYDRHRHVADGVVATYIPSWPTRTRRPVRPRWRR
jgi:glutaminase